MDAACIILARAGSKGVPGKAWRPVAGRPCIAWTIEDALAAETVGTIAVSTDSPEVASVSREMGVRVLERPSELATDDARVDDAARLALHQLDAISSEGASGPHEGQPVVLLYANVPIRPVGLIDRAVRLLVESGCDSVQSYAPLGKHHPWWTCRLDERGEVAPWQGEVLNHGVFRRQDLPPAFVPDGGVIALTRAALELRIPGVVPGPHAFFGGDRRGVKTREGEVVDIDAPIDLALAEALLRVRSCGAGGTGEDARKGAMNELPPSSPVSLGVPPCPRGCNGERP